MSLLDKVPTFWRPEPGASLFGVLRALKPFYSPHYQASINSALIEDENGKMWSVSLAPVVLAREFAKAGPAVGCPISISYLGEATSKQGNKYKRFIVHVDKNTHFGDVA